MLVLSRRRNEQIVIGENIVVTVVDIRVGNVRLGVEAPKSVPVHRKEIHEALRSRQPPAGPRRVNEDAVGSRSE